MASFLGAPAADSPGRAPAARDAGAQSAVRGLGLAGWFRDDDPRIGLKASGAKKLPVQGGVWVLQWGFGTLHGSGLWAVGSGPLVTLCIPLKWQLRIVQTYHI